MPKLSKNIQKMFFELHNRGGLLCRQFSKSREASEFGNEYLYFTVKDNRPFSARVGAFLVEKELVKSRSDGLFADTPQSFQAVSAAEFNHFKELYEQM